jgi:hypothetical protein
MTKDMEVLTGSVCGDLVCDMTVEYARS